MSHHIRATIVSLCALLPGAVASASPGVSPSQEEAGALAQLRGQVVGRIIWESNRDGTWQLYTMNADGTGARRLTSGPGDNTQACLSADGKRALFTRSVPGKPQAVWIMGSDGSGARELVANACTPEWREAGQAVEFLRQPDPRQQHWQTWQHDLRTGQERLLFPPQGVKFEPDIWSATGNDEGTRFVAWSPRPRGTWVLSSDGRVQKHVHGGCEGQVSPDQRYGYGVKTAGVFVRFSLSDGEGLLPFSERSGPWSHTYFPRVSRDGDWLIYAACPPDQHDQDISDYEIFIVRMREWATQGEPVRLSFNRGTDRWPTVFVADPGSTNPLPDGPHDVAGNPNTNPPAPPLTILSFADENAGPDFGGHWGMWPQEGGCRGTATFMKGDDATGNGGGSIRVDYQIGGEPNSVALWVTPGAGTVDLSAYGRFVLYAKGDVPSFTVVVKDRNSEEEETPKGVADYFVKGVTTRWQRFELPFGDFRPRERGAKVDWSGIKLMAVALIDPHDARSGTLQVDNLQALPAAGG